MCWQKLIPLSNGYAAIKICVCVHTRWSELSSAFAAESAGSLARVTDQCRYSLTAPELFGSVPLLWSVIVTGWTWWALSSSTSSQTTLLYHKASHREWLGQLNKIQLLLLKQRSDERVCLWCCFCQGAKAMWKCEITERKSKTAL